MARQAFVEGIYRYQMRRMGVNKALIIRSDKKKIAFQTIIYIFIYLKERQLFIFTLTFNLASTYIELSQQYDNRERERDLT